MGSLSLEQQFAAIAFEHQAQQLNREQAFAMAVALYQQLIVQQNCYKQLLTHQWGIDDPTGATSDGISQAP